MQTHSHKDNSKVFITILADGKFHQTVPEGTPNAITREYEDKEGVKQTKTELVHDSITGKITGIAFEDGEYGKSIQLTIDNEGIISAGTASNFGEDLMKKLPSVDFSKEVKLAPYAFEADGKSKKGVTVYQDDVKLESFYWDSVAKKAVNSLPEPEGDTSKFDSDDWKMHFMKVRKFLVEQTGKLAADKFFEPANEVEAQTDAVSIKDF